MTDCGAKHYRGIQKPRCNHGKPCDACIDKYVQARLEYILYSDLESDPIVLRRSAANALEVLGQRH